MSLTVYTVFAAFVLACAAQSGVTLAPNRPNCDQINAQCDALVATCNSQCHTNVSCTTAPTVICSSQLPLCQRAREICMILYSGTLLPTREPTPRPTTVPTPAPTRVPTSAPVPTPAPPVTPSPPKTPSPPGVTAYPRCDDVAGIEVARKVRYYSAGPGTTFTFPVDLYVAGFAVTFTWGPGMRCHDNSRFPENSYLGCEINGYKGFSEFIVDGPNRGDPILVPSASDPNFKPMLYDSPANESLLLYSLKNCEFSPLQINMRASLSAPRMIRKGTVMSLWHSEAYYNFDIGNNIGFSEVSIFAIKAYTPAPTMVPTLKPTRVPTPVPTHEPTRLPTNAPHPVSQLKCSLGRDTLALSPLPLPYNSTGPGTQFKSPWKVLAKGFAVEFRSGRGIRCTNGLFTPSSYLGCSTPIQGFAETIVLGAGRNGQVLLPDPSDPRLIPLATIPGDSSKILTYGLTNCAFPSALSTLVKIFLPTPVQINVGDVITLWNSEAFYEYSTADNSGSSNVVMHVVR